MEIVSQTTLTPPRKRALEEDAAIPQATPTKPPFASPSSDTSSPPLTVLSTQPSPSASVIAAARQPSPAPSSNQPTSGDAQASAQHEASSTDAHPTKRRKLTVKEKEDQRLEKEAKEKAKAELKAQKEEEKKAKDEERRRKHEEKEEKKRAKELELQQKEVEKRRKEEEKQKKEKSQLRLNSFFAKPAKSAEDATSGPSVETIAQDTNSISLEPESSISVANMQPSPQKPNKNATMLSDYERFFLPFQLPAHAILAPYNQFIVDRDYLESARQRMEEFQGQDAMDLDQLATFKSQFKSKAPRGTRTVAVEHIIERLNGSSDHPIDLTDDTSKISQQPLELLKRVPMKYLHFGEDVRPPYYGTYTKLPPPKEAAKLARNPYYRGLHEADYEYDSEAEWEEPEEGEDLDSEGEDEMDDDGEDDMEGFLDDEEDLQNKRRLISGDLEPVSTGLCWEDGLGVSVLNDGSGAICTDFKDFRMGFLLEPQPHSIDPFSTAYWAPAPVSAKTLAVPSKETQTNGAMNPPRLPLAARPNSMVNGMNVMNSTNPVKQLVSLTSAGTVSKPAKAPKRMVPPEILQEFKNAIEGSDLTKIALVEALKKKFPKMPKDAISNTLSAVASRVGAKEVDKRWKLI